jgi:AcrR family transcriptional regulator
VVNSAAMADATKPRRPESGNQPRAERTRQTVIDETVHYILEEGFTAPSVRRITERAGLTWGVVQYHFGDLDGLLMAVVSEGLRQLTEVIEQLPALATGETPRRRVETVIDAVWPAFSSPTSMAALEILISTRRTRAKAINARLAAVDRRFRELGAHLGTDLSAPHAAEIGDIIWTMLRGIVVAQMVSPAPLDTTRDRNTFIDVLTAYLEANDRCS